MHMVTLTVTACRLNCPVVHINTAQGGGIGGPLCIDHEHRFNQQILDQYTEVPVGLIEWLVSVLQTCRLRSSQDHVIVH